MGVAIDVCFQAARARPIQRADARCCAVRLGVGCLQDANAARDGDPRDRGHDEAGSVLTTRVIVGANHGTWTKQQDVEVMVKLSAAHDGTMRWSSRCRASSDHHDTANQAIEAAARCAVNVITAPTN
jgi:hypothetical protein